MHPSAISPWGVRAFELNVVIKAHCDMYVAFGTTCRHGTIMRHPGLRRREVKHRRENHFPSKSLPGVALNNCLAPQTGQVRAIGACLKYLCKTRERRKLVGRLRQFSMAIVLYRMIPELILIRLLRITGIRNICWFWPGEQAMTSPWYLNSVFT